MNPVALERRFSVHSEIEESLAELCVPSLTFSDVSELERILSGPDEGRPSFVLDVNFHPELREACRRHGVNYAMWSFDSGVGPLMRLHGVNPGEPLFIFNKADYEICRGLTEESFYMPFSASPSFERAPSASGFSCPVVAVMDSYASSEKTCEAEFNRVFLESGEPSARRMLEFCRTLMEYAADFQTPDILRDRTREAAADIILKCGVNPFDGDGQGFDSLCRHAGQLAASRQRVELAKALSGSGIGLRLYGDSAWPDLLGGSPGVEFMGWADYKLLPEVYNSAKIVVNLTQVQNNDSVPQRIFHALAAGAFVLSNPSEPLLELFTPGVHLETFASFEEMLAKARLHLADDERRNMIAAAGHEEFMRSHRMSSRLKRIVSRCVSPS